jgi:hypothetical protein
MLTSIINTGKKTISQIPRNNMTIVVVHKPKLLDDTSESYKNNPICTAIKFTKMEQEKYLYVILH